MDQSICSMPMEYVPTPIQEMSPMLANIPYMQHLANKEWRIIWDNSGNIEWGYSDEDIMSMLMDIVEETTWECEGM